MALLTVQNTNAQTADFTINITQGCVPLSGVNFTDVSSGGTVINRNWDLGNGTLIPNGPVTVGTNYLTAGSYVVSLTVNFSGGITKTVSKNVTVHPKPIAAFSSADTVGCLPHAASFTDLSTTATGNIVSWQWDLGDGGSTLQNPSFIYNNAGNFQVSLIVKNSWGCSSNAASIPAYIKVYPKPVVSFTTAVNSSCTAPFTVNFTNTSTGSGPITWEWDFGDGSPLSTQANPSHTYLASGRYRVRLTARLGNNCSSTNTTNYYSDIWVGTPTPQINSADTVCVNNQINFYGSASPASIAYSYRWIFTDDNSIRNGANVTHVFSSPGNVEVLLIANTYYGCSDTVRKMIHVKPGPQIGFMANNLTGCMLPHIVQFTDTSSPATGHAFLWNFGDGATSTLQHPQHTYNTAGNFTVTLTITDTTIVDGCSASITKNSYIRIRIPTVNFIYVPPSGCLPLPVLATAQLGNMIEPADTLIWNWGDGNYDTITNGTLPALHTYTIAGNFGIQLTLITVSGCRYVSIVKNVSVIPVCDDDGSGGGGGGGGGGFMVGKNCTNKYQVTLTDTVTNTVVTEWDFGDGNILNTGTLNPVTHNYAPPQKVYLVKVTRLDTITNVISTGVKNVIIIDEKANFIPDITDICQNKTVRFTTLGIDSSKIKNYTWDFGDGSPRFVINNLANFNNYGLWLNGNTSHVYVSNGLFYVKLIIEDKLGCLDSLLYPVPITVKGPDVGFSATNLNSCDAVQPVVFTDSSKQNGSTPIVEWRWNFGDGTPVYISTVDTPITHIYNNPAYYNFRTVTLTITDAIGCMATVTKLNYIKGYRPKAQFFSYDTLRCNVYNVFLYNQSSAYNASYTWFYGDGSSSVGYHGSHTYATNGTYDIKLLVIDENGCKDSVIKNNYIKIIEPIADFNIGDTTQCAPAAISFTDNSNYATGWQWDFGDGSTGTTDQNPAPHIYALPGFYQVRLIVSSVNNCVDTVYKQVRIRGPIASLQAVASNGCKPYTFNASVTGSFIKTYAWDFGDGTPVNASTTDSVVSHTYVNTGKFLPNVVLISPEGCPYTLKLSDSIIVDSAKALFNPINRVFCDSGTVQFTNLSTTTSFSSFTNYEWNFGDGSPASYAENPPPHLYNSPGDYTVWLKVNSLYGCTDTFTQAVAVKINPSPTPAIIADSILCSPGLYTISGLANATDAVADVEWRVNGVVAGNANDLSYFFNAGNYTLSFKVKTVNNCETIVQKNIIVDSVKANFVVLDPVRCADNLLVNFTNTSGSFFGINQYQWSFGDGANSANQHPAAHQYPGYGNYNVQLITTSVHGCKDSLLMQPAVIIHPLPAVNIVGDSLHCRPGTYSYTANINSVDAIQTYEWRVNGTLMNNNSASLQHNFSAGNYTIGLKVFTNNNCTDEVQKNIIVDSVKADFVVLDPVRCADNLLVNFTNTSGSFFGINQYQWSFGDGANSANQHPAAHQYPGYGNYNVQLITTSVHGCKDSLLMQPAVIIHPLPAVNIVGDSLHCRPGTYSYTANINSVDAIQTYEWRVNGILMNNNSASLQHNFSAGNYTIGLKVFTNNNCTDEVQKNIIVDSVKADFVVERPVRCGSTDLTVNFSNLSGSRFGVAAYQWNFGDGQTATIANPTHVYQQAGTYEVTLVTTSIHGCTDTLRILQAVIIYETPVVNFIGEFEKCMQNELSFSAQVTSQDLVNSYEWKMNGNVIGHNNVQTYYFSNAGTYQLSLTVSTVNGCMVTETKTVTIRPLPVPNAGPNTSICTGSSVPLYASDGNAYAWTPVTHLQNAHTATPIASPIQNTTYRVKVTNSFGCVQYDSVLIKVDEKVNLRTGPNQITCRGTAVKLTVSGNSNQFIWTPATGLSNTTGRETYANPNQTTTYSVVGVSQNVCPSDTGYITVTVGDIPTVNLGPDLQVNAGSANTIPTTTTGGVTSYNWTPTTGLNCSTCAQPTFVADKNIQYKVLVTTQYGCEATDELNVVVLCNKGAVYIPNAFTPNNDGKNDVFYVSGYGIANVKRFAIYDRWGKLVFQKQHIAAGDRSQGWNGRVGNQELTVTTAFVYIVEVTCTQGNSLLLKGSVLVIK